MIRIVMIVAIAATALIPAQITMADNIQLKLQSIEKDAGAPDKPRKVIQEETWNASQTAIIVCDVWDYHHCLNAVRRLEEFAPRLDQVLKAARKSGAIIIHAPSDCMPAYADHPARKRAIETPAVDPLPKDIHYWCSRLEQEGRNYPIDQSDGGEDDDPQEHGAWGAKLKGMGRNPGMPWKEQSKLITIDAARDYITDRGDEVWNILEKQGIRNVILTGVHCNMCVLGRPFGLRQMVRNGKHVVLMRDMTDSMYSPKSWPYVDHFTGHDRVLAYVEEHICPTITSDQFLGGEPFRWKAAPRHSAPDSPALAGQPVLVLRRRWTTVDVNDATVASALQKVTDPVWYRGALPLPAEWQHSNPLYLEIPDQGDVQVWLNGHEIAPRRATKEKSIRFMLPQQHIAENDYNLLVVKTGSRSAKTWDAELVMGSERREIEPYWQVRVGTDEQFSNIPLPAKFGIGPDAVLTISNKRKAPDSPESPEEK